MAIGRESVAAAPSPVTAEAKLALLEDFQRCRDLATAAQHAAEWLVAYTSARRTLFAAPDPARGLLTAIAGAGMSPRQFKRFSLSLDDASHPLVSALNNGNELTFHNARDLKVPL